ncbi:DUF3048 domain-containing protein, partial [Streptomyces pharetrae]|uniref:DUF3048 domain-containing protein n=1 Tax=Streptomyces pharetrae TaxID=291370 RepID=UPI00365ADB1E
MASHSGPRAVRGSRSRWSGGRSGRWPHLLLALVLVARSRCRSGAFALLTGSSRGVAWWGRPVGWLRGADGELPRHPVGTTRHRERRSARRRGPQARPQVGLGDADIVYAEQVEAGLSRFL